MKKILFVINTLGRAGAETALLQLLKKIDPKEFEISLYVLTGQGEMISALPTYVRILNRKYKEVSVLSAEGKKVLSGTCLQALFKRGNVFTKAPYIIGNALAMLRKKQLMPDKLLWRVLSDAADRFDTEYDLAVAYLEGGSTYYVAEHVKAKKKAAFVHVDYEKAGYTPSLDRNCYASFDKIFTVSDEVKASFLRMYPQFENRMGIFHNILDAEEIRQKAAADTGFTDSYDGVRIVTVGRLTAQKAFEVSIDAMKMLKDAGVKARWYVMGEGDRRKMLEGQIQKLGLEQDFILMGAVTNPYPYMAQADLYVHCSKFEGKSIAIQEAQILGKAILVSDCSGNREQVVQDVDGILCAFEAGEIAKQIQLLLRNPEKCSLLGQQARLKNEESGQADILLDLLRDE